MKNLEKRIERIEQALAQNPEPLRVTVTYIDPADVRHDSEGKIISAIKGGTPAIRFTAGDPTSEERFKDGQWVKA